MTQLSAHDPGDDNEPRLPRRDWLVLPALSLLTIVLISTSLELAARRIFATQSELPSCLASDPVRGIHPIANSSCYFKPEEHPLVDYRFNSRSHYAGMEYGAKSPDLFRVVMTGSSYAMGYGVPRGASIAALLPKELSRRTGRRIELYNEGQLWQTPRVTALRFDEVLAAKPDLILWVVSFWDVRNASVLFAGLDVLPDTDVSTPVVQGGFKSKLLPKLRRFIENPQKERYLGHIFYKSSFGIKHYLYESQSLYLKSYLLRGDGDGDSGYLRANPSETWKTGLAHFDGLAAQMAARAENAGIPFVIAFVPDRAAAALVSRGEWPAGIDPYKMDQEMRSAIVGRGGIYLDTLPEFRSIPNPEHGFEPMDDHPNEYGSGMISDLLAKKLTDGAVPALNASR